MQTTAFSPFEYFNTLPAERKVPMQQLWQVIADNLPQGFEAAMGYGMPGFVVPHALYPAGYHCDSKQALPFISIASQKNFISLYHMGLYADAELFDWFTAAYAAQSKTKLDMGKSCIRFKKAEHIPFGLIGELAAKITPLQWIRMYEYVVKKAN